MNGRGQIQFLRFLKHFIAACNIFQNQNSQRRTAFNAFITITYNQVKVEYKLPTHNTTMRSGQYGNLNSIIYVWCSHWEECYKKSIVWPNNLEAFIRNSNNNDNTEKTNVLGVGASTKHFSEK
jgi:hypothetical protein